MNLEDLEIYQMARKISNEVWKIYEGLDWREKKVMGDQFVSATDSVGANIAEGFGRYHFLDKNKFNYNARGSLLESIFWLEILRERGKITEELFGQLKNEMEVLHKKLNNFINSTKNQNIKHF